MLLTVSCIKDCKSFLIILTSSSTNIADIFEIILITNFLKIRLKSSILSIPSTYSFPTALDITINGKICFGEHNVFIMAIGIILKNSVLIEASNSNWGTCQLGFLDRPSNIRLAYLSDRFELVSTPKSKNPSNNDNCESTSTGK